jgi:ketosteroid isomerase-like protein
VARENLEIVRAIYSALAVGDREGLVADVDPSIRIYDRPTHPDASVYEGHEGLLHFSDVDSEAFDQVAYEPQDFRAMGPWVIVPVKQSGVGKSSSLGVEEHIVNVWKLERGQCVELRIFSTLQEAEAAISVSY